MISSEQKIPYPSVTSHFVSAQIYEKCQKNQERLILTETRRHIMNRQATKDSSEAVIRDAIGIKNNMGCPRDKLSFVKKL